MDNDGMPSALWNEAYDAVGPSRDDMWDWLEERYLACRDALAEMKERSEKLEAGLLAVSQFWTTPEFIAMQQAAMLALSSAALSSPETPE